MFSDDFDEIEEILNGLFNPSSTIRRHKSKYIDYQQSERSMDNEHVYFTLVLKNNPGMGEISVTNELKEVYVNFNTSSLTDDNVVEFMSPRPLIPETSSFTYRENTGVLDITVDIDRELYESIQEDKHSIHSI